MLFPEEEAPLLKAWVVKRIENTSDADADVLAEYVIALLKHDGDVESVRKLCEQEIPDFLTEDPKVFLDDVFQAITYKSYLPRPKNAAPSQAAALESNALPYDDSPPGRSRKRGLDDLDGGRAPKQPRRGGRGGPWDEMRGGFGGYDPMAGPLPRPELDASNPMEIFMQLQAMGFPGMPVAPGFRAGRNQPRRKGRCRDFDTKGYCARGNTCLYDHGNESVFVPPSGEEYDPNDAIMSMPSMNPFAFNPDAARGRGGRRARRGKRGAARAPFSADGPVHDRSKTTIVIENIPEEHFSEDEVRTFFSQFGNVVNVSMQPYKHLAVVKYDKWGSANAAYRSPKVIFDNRFVKVFWYKDDKDLSANGSAPSHDENNDVDNAEREPEVDMEEFQRKQEEAQKQHLEREAKRAELEQKRQDLERQQQELLTRHREENERLQAKLIGQSNGNGDAGSGSTGTDMLRAKLAALEQEAKMLGIDPHAVEDTSFGYPSPGGHRGRGGYRARGFAPRGRGSFRGRGAMHAAYAQYSIDNRPKKLAITGVDFTASDKDEQLRHFLLNLGEFESVDTAPTVTHVTFQDRKTAEKFYYSLHGKELPDVDGKLDLQWVNTPLPPVASTSASNNDAHDDSQDKDEAMVGHGDDGDGEKEGEREGKKEGASMDYPPSREERQVDMDYEVADEDPW